MVVLSSQASHFAIKATSASSLGCNTLRLIA